MTLAMAVEAPVPAGTMPSVSPITPNTASQLVWLKLASSMMLMVPTSLLLMLGLRPASQAATKFWNSVSAPAVVPLLPYHLLTENRSFVR